MEFVKELCKLAKETSLPEKEIVAEIQKKNYTSSFDVVIYGIEDCLNSSCSRTYCKRYR